MTDDEIDRAVARLSRILARLLAAFGPATSPPPESGEGTVPSDRPQG